jgi:hypothetical protein
MVVGLLTQRGVRVPLKPYALSEALRDDQGHVRVGIGHRTTSGPACQLGL